MSRSQGLPSTQLDSSELAELVSLTSHLGRGFETNPGTILLALSTVANPTASSVSWLRRVCQLTGTTGNRDVWYLYGHHPGLPACVHFVVSQRRWLSHYVAVGGDLTMSCYASSGPSIADYIRLRAFDSSDYYLTPVGPGVTGAIDRDPSMAVGDLLLDLLPITTTAILGVTERLRRVLSGIRYPHCRMSLLSSVADVLLPRLVESLSMPKDLGGGEDHSLLVSLVGLLSLYPLHPQYLDLIGRCGVPALLVLDRGSTIKRVAGLHPSTTLTPEMRVQLLERIIGDCETHLRRLREINHTQCSTLLSLVPWDVGRDPSVERLSNYPPWDVLYELRGDVVVALLRDGEDECTSPTRLERRQRQITSASKGWGPCTPIRELLCNLKVDLGVVLQLSLRREVPLRVRGE